MNLKMLVGIFLTVVVLAVCVTLAVAHDESGHYYACVNNASGTIHMVQSGDECNSNEEMYIWNVQGVKGDKGDPGNPGPPGADGADGADGASCSVTQNDGSATIECTDDTIATVNDGVDGANGAPGDPGVPGVAGDDGTSCSVTQNLGSATIECTDNTSATVNDGADGAPGDSGTPGADGSSCSVTESDGSVTIECTDGTGATVHDGVDGVNGAPGPEGPPGESWEDALFTKQVTPHALFEGSYSIDGGTSICPEGTTVVSGGYGLSPYHSVLLDQGHFIVLENTPYSDEESGETGWQVTLYSEGIFDIFPGYFVLDVIAWCVGVNQEVGEPTAEVCDGIDNDLDTEIDEDFPTKNAFCTAGIGVCMGGGVNVCTPDGSDVMCSAVPGFPTQATETSCSDGLDNDCDGLTDESDDNCSSS